MGGGLCEMRIMYRTGSGGIFVGAGRRRRRRWMVNWITPEMLLTLMRGVRWMRHLRRLWSVCLRWRCRMINPCCLVLAVGLTSCGLLVVCGL